MKKERFLNWQPPLFDAEGWAYNKDGKKYGWRCQHPDGLKLGKNVDIGCFTYINAKYDVEIGDNTQIGAHCAIYSINTENKTHGKITIGNNVLIGAYTLILPSIMITSGTKIKARSILK